MNLFQEAHFNGDIVDDDDGGAAEATLCIAGVRGWRYSVIYSGKEGGEDGHLDNTIQLMEGKFPTKVLSEFDEDFIERELYEMGTFETFTCRQDPSVKIILQTKLEHIKNKAAADLSMRKDIRIVKEVTERLNETVMKLREWYDYIVVDPIHETNIYGQPVSLDRYLLDPDVIYVMENSGCNLGPFFAHTEDAAMFFSPERMSYPEGLHKYGFVDRE